MSLCAIPSVARQESVPQGMSTSDWLGIRAAYEANRHAVVPNEDGFQARNPGQRWMTRFDSRGFVVTPDSGCWSWGLELIGFGRSSEQRAVADVPECIEVSGQRVEYHWDEALTEWYINDQRGLEHGYTVNRPPDGSEARSAGGPLQIMVRVRGGLCPRVTADGRGVTFFNDGGAAVVNYAGLTVLDADGHSLPAHLESVANALCFIIDDAAARYPLTIDPIAQQAYLKASNTETTDEFGFSVAVSGDTAVVGAIREDSGATGVNGNQNDESEDDSGAVYVFVRSGGTWSQQAYLKASNTEELDVFGWSVAISGDTVVVGARGEDSNATGVNGDQSNNGANDSGAAYVFVRDGDLWSQQAYLKASNTHFSDRFGHSVAVSGDTVLVGAYLEDEGGSQAGAAYVFVRSGDQWSQQAYLKASDAFFADQFGYSVGVSGDTAVVGAWFEDSSATGVNGEQDDFNAQDSGAAYVFVRSGDLWNQQAYLKASNTEFFDLFGASVAVSGDTVIVGARDEDSSATGVNGDQNNNGAGDSGAAYVFVRNGGVWSQQAYLKASNTGINDGFGVSTAASGDRVVVGASREDSNATGVDGNQADNSAADSGASYVFTRSGGVWSQEAYVKASNTEAGDQFAASVAISGDTVVIGAYQEDSSATGVNGNQADNTANASGAAYVFTDGGSDCASDACNGNETLTVKSATKGCGCRVKAILKHGIVGSTYAFTMADGTCLTDAANNKGKAVVKQCPSSSGMVQVMTCGLTANASCP